jgi:hypothetical protein
VTWRELLEKLQSLGLRRRTNVLKNLAQQQKTINSKLFDIDRMDKGAKSVYDNLVEVLDVKQKHGNSVEVRISRDKALEALLKKVGTIWYSP